MTTRHRAAKGAVDSKSDVVGLVEMVVGGCKSREHQKAEGKNRYGCVKWNTPYLLILPFCDRKAQSKF